MAVRRVASIFLYINILVVFFVLFQHTAAQAQEQDVNDSVFEHLPTDIRLYMIDNAPFHLAFCDNGDVGIWQFRKRGVFDIFWSNLSDGKTRKEVAILNEIKLKDMVAEYAYSFKTENGEYHLRGPDKKAIKAAAVEQFTDTGHHMTLIPYPYIKREIRYSHYEAFYKLTGEREAWNLNGSPPVLCFGVVHGRYIFFNTVTHTVFSGVLNHDTFDIEGPNFLLTLQEDWLTKFVIGCSASSFYIFIFVLLVSICLLILLVPGLTLTGYMRRRHWILGGTDFSQYEPFALMSAFFVPMLYGFIQFWLYSGAFKWLTFSEDMRYAGSVVWLLIVLLCLTIPPWRRCLYAAVTARNVKFPLGLAVSVICLYSGICYLYSYPALASFSSVNNTADLRIYGLLDIDMDNIIPLVWLKSMLGGYSVWGAVLSPVMGATMAERTPGLAGTIAPLSLLFRFVPHTPMFLAAIFAVETCLISFVWAYFSKLRISIGKCIIYIAVLVHSLYLFRFMLYGTSKLIGGVLLLWACYLFFVHPRLQGRRITSGEALFCGILCGFSCFFHLNAVYLLIPMAIFGLLPRYFPGLKKVLLMLLGMLVIIGPYMAGKALLGAPSDKGSFQRYIFCQEKLARDTSISFADALVKSYSQLTIQEIAAKKYMLFADLMYRRTLDQSFHSEDERTIKKQMIDKYFFMGGALWLGWLAYLWRRNRPATSIENAANSSFLLLGMFALLVLSLSLFGWSARMPSASSILFSLGIPLLIFVSLTYCVTQLPAFLRWFVSAFQVIFFHVTLQPLAKSPESQLQGANINLLSLLLQFIALMIFIVLFLYARKAEIKAEEAECMPRP